MSKKFNHLTKTTAFMAADETLQRLQRSLDETLAESERLASKLAAWDVPRGADAVTTALEIIEGTAPIRPAMSALATEHTNAITKAEIIRLAIAQQRALMSTLGATLSAEANAARRSEHAEAVRAIAAALKSLDDALGIEETIRDSIALAGYRCTLPSFELAELGRLKHKFPDSLMLRAYRDSSDYVTDCDDEASGKLDQPTVVHLLADALGIGSAGDVVSIDGRQARLLVRIGRAEETTEKPRRVAKRMAGVREAVLE